MGVALRRLSQKDLMREQRRVALGLSLHYCRTRGFLVQSRSCADSQRRKKRPGLPMQKMIGIALIGAGLLGIIQVLWAQSGDFNTQTREPKQSMPEGNGGSSLARWAKPVHRSSPEAVTVIVNLPPARTPSEPRLQTTHMVTDRASLTRTLQSELRRVGCYVGYVNGDWTTSTRNAMKAFTDYVNARLPVDRPDIVLLSLIQGHEGKACRGSCPPGQDLKDGHCIPNALIVHAKKPENVAPLVAQTASHPTQAAALADFNQPCTAPAPASSQCHRPAAGTAARTFLWALDFYSTRKIEPVTEDRMAS
jgi:hypothetical protein